MNNWFALLRQYRYVTPSLEFLYAPPLFENRWPAKHLIPLKRTLHRPTWSYALDSNTILVEQCIQYYVEESTGPTVSKCMNLFKIKCGARTSMHQRLHTHTHTHTHFSMHFQFSVSPILRGRYFGDTSILDNNLRGKSCKLKLKSD